MVNFSSAHRLTPPLAQHAEGPVWDEDRGILHFVDMLVGDIISLDEAGRLLDRQSYGEPIVAMRGRLSGGLVVGVERGFGFISPDGQLSKLPDLWSDPSIRMNEGACDTVGRFHCGSMAYDARPGAGALYRLNSDGTTTKVLDNLTISNGLAFTPDGAGAILVDSPTQEIRRYRLPEGDEPWSVFETIATISPQDGIPDGICLDAEGGVWVALWGGSRVHRYSMSGQLTDVIDLPASQVTACALGGVDGCTLFISTSRLGLSSDPEPHDGAIFMSRVKIPGSPLALARG